MLVGDNNCLSYMRCDDGSGWQNLLAVIEIKGLELIISIWVNTVSSSSKAV